MMASAKPEDIDSLFKDAEIARIARESKLPSNTDIAILAKGIRASVQQYLREASATTEPEKRRLIFRLHNAAFRARDYPTERAIAVLLRLLEELPADVREYIAGMGQSTYFPERSAIRDPGTRMAAINAIIAAVSFGGEFVMGQKRQNGRRSRPRVQPYLYAPSVRRGRPPDDAAQNLIMHLSVDFLMATGGRHPPLEVHAIRGAPFMSLVQAVLEQAGIARVSAAEAINRFGRARRDAAEK